ncbi:MAG: DUF4440 domain-containing protein [Methylococcales bacterium]
MKQIRFVNRMVVGVIALVLAQATAAETPRQSVENSIDKWNAALNSASIEDIMSLYANNAMLVQPDGKIAKSSKEIRSFWKAMLVKGAYAVDIENIRGDKNSIVMATRLASTATLSDTQNDSTKYYYSGTIMNVFKRQNDGSWKAQVQQWDF